MTESHQHQVQQLADRALKLAAALDAAALVLDDAPDEHTRNADTDLHMARQEAMDTARHLLGVTALWRTGDASTTWPPAASTEQHLRDLRQYALSLTGDLRDLAAALKRATDRNQQAGWWVAEAAATSREISTRLLRTLRLLQRISSVPADACRMDRPACPIHGATICTSGGETWCQTPGCPYWWPYDRWDTPCPEPVTHQVTDATGTIRRVCSGHAVAARQTGTTITRLNPAQP
ncbi:hypothetical protein [Actinomadura rupiterrae]|uniref:hypothetical protein n=1 Tax=Actinomadura rupiterrae TaxID=559627 RepID=UPI0020A45D14|nr:hypothetical protein [Actinomadura rupiterrae]MCP2337895.1 hypothetical protein [Actinomadura rupiterrae]